MKKTIRLISVLTASALISCFALFGCSSADDNNTATNTSCTAVAPVESSASNSSATPSAGDIVVTVDLIESATSPEAPDSPDQFSEENLTVTVADGASAYDALQATGRNIDTTGSGDNLEVTAIGGLTNGDAGASSHWEFSVNGQVMTESPAVYILSDGDALTFNFVA